MPEQLTQTQRMVLPVAQAALEHGASRDIVAESMAISVAELDSILDHERQQTRLQRIIRNLIDECGNRNESLTPDVIAARARILFEHELASGDSEEGDTDAIDADVLEDFAVNFAEADAVIEFIGEQIFDRSNTNGLSDQELTQHAMATYLTWVSFAAAHIKDLNQRERRKIVKEHRDYAAGMFEAILDDGEGEAA